MSQHVVTHPGKNRTMQQSLATEHSSARSISMKHQGKFWQNLRVSGLMRSALIFLTVLAPVLSAHAAVVVDQSPLIVQKRVAPDIVLMLDDSGSMNNNYMPDNARGVDSTTNYVYYNPNYYYQAPKFANGTDYPNATFPNAALDYFADPTAVTDIQTYRRGWDYYKRSSSTVGGNNSGNCGWGHRYNCVFRYDDPATHAENYVGVSCAGFNSNCHLASDPLTVNTDTGPITTTYGQMVANWFSYYQTRIMMAQTGLTLAFSDLDPSYRLGFASINGRNTANIPSPFYSFRIQTNGNNRLAEVQPFGDGSNGTQKDRFWNWVTTLSTGGTTPLRNALKTVGEYYSTAQPWLPMTTSTSNGVTTVTTGSASNSAACRPAYTILTTDGYWNESVSPNVGNVDGASKTVTTTPSTYQYQAQQPFSDTYSNTLADVAMKFWATDLCADSTTGCGNIANEVPTTTNDPAFWQHMTTFTLGMGFAPTGITPSTLTMDQIFTWAHTGNRPAGVTNFSWPQPVNNTVANIADLAHAAVNGHGNFFSARNPGEFVSGIKAALSAIDNTPGAGNAVTLSGTSLPTVSSTDPFFQFRATYTMGLWTGTLAVSQYNASATPAGYTSSWWTNTWVPTFDTATGLSDRNVWTTKDGTAAQSVAFKKASDLSSAEQAGLAAYSGTSAQTMLNYLLGDHTYEVGSSSGTLRARVAVLGDVISSTPVYVAKPDKTLFENGTFPGASSYQTFVANNASRAPIVYVAANDGMLHAFRVEDGAGYNANGTFVASQPKGTEVYAYMPEAVLTQSGAGSITNLANPQYGVINKVDGTQAVPHQYYNDGRMTVQNVYFSSDSAWHTVLVGTTGRGPAKAIYALDITNPTTLMNPATAKNALLWERSAGDGKSGSDYIGEMVGAPVIAQVKQDGATDPSWAVFVGNGYNSAQNKAALLQFNLQTGALTVHTTNSTTDNGLAEPGVMQGDTKTGVSTYAFGGDLFGNVWKFDLNTSNSAGSRIFIAKDAGGATQPITSLIALTYDSGTDSTFALFGTGKYLANADVNNAQIQTWYGIRVGAGADLSGTATTLRPVATATSTRSDLAARYAIDLSGNNRATSLQAAGDMDNKVGWYMDLPDNGERIVNRTQFISGTAVVTTLIPKVNDPCNNVPAGAVMLVDPFTGTNRTADYGLGTSSITYTNSSGHSVTQTVAINGTVLGTGAAAGVTANYTSGGQVELSFNNLKGDLQTLGPLTLGGGMDGRVSWRELVN